MKKYGLLRPGVGKRDPLTPALSSKEEREILFGTGFHKDVKVIVFSCKVC
jgi:hypothetical protein